MRDVLLRGALRALGAFLLVQHCCAQSLTSPITSGTITVRLSSVASISTATAGEPLDLSQPVGDSARDFVATHGAQIRLIKNGSLLGTPFCDITAILAAGAP